MKSSIKSKSFKVALGGIIAALSVALMFMTGLIPTLTYAIPAICGFLLTIIVVEISPAFAFAVYFAVSFISIFLVADKEAALFYALFFGYYSIIKGYIERKCNKTVEWIVKLIIFNISVVAASLIATKVFMIPFGEFGALGKMAIPLLLVLGNVVFVIYDIALTRIISVYVYKWRKYIKRLFK